MGPGNYARPIAKRAHQCLPERAPQVYSSNRPTPSQCSAVIMRSSLTVDRPQPSPQSHHSHSLTWEAEVKRMSTNLHPHHSRTAASPWLSATITIYTAVVRSQPIYSRCTITPTKIAPVNKFILNHHVYDILKFYMFCSIRSGQRSFQVQRVWLGPIQLPSEQLQWELRNL